MGAGSSGEPFPRLLGAAPRPRRPRLLRSFPARLRQPRPQEVLALSTLSLPLKPSPQGGTESPPPPVTATRSCPARQATRGTQGAAGTLRTAPQSASGPRSPRSARSPGPGPGTTPPRDPRPPRGRQPGTAHRPLLRMLGAGRGGACAEAAACCVIAFEPSGGSCWPPRSPGAVSGAGCARRRGLAMARQLAREQGITLRGSADIVAEFFCESPARRGGSRASAGTAASRRRDGGPGRGGCGRDSGRVEREARCRRGPLAVWPLPGSARKVPPPPGPRARAGRAGLPCPTRRPRRLGRRGSGPGGSRRLAEPGRGRGGRQARAVGDVRSPRDELGLELQRDEMWSRVTACLAFSFIAI